VKRNAKQDGAGGRLRLGLLMAFAAAFLLVPAVAASAATVTVIPEGAGSGVVENAPHGGGAVAKGETLYCHWNGTEVDEDIDSNPGNGICEDETYVEEGFDGYGAYRTADSGSEFGGAWGVSGAAIITGCTASSGFSGEFCSVAFPSGPVTLTVPFALEPEEYPLNLTTSGGGSGSFECDSGGGLGACAAEYVEGTEVEVVASPDTGSTLDKVEGTGSAAACAASPCTVTMNEAGSIDAEFNVETFAFGVTVIGEGTVKCNGVACAAEYDYGTNVEVTATPNSVEFVLAEISGTGSASGCATSPCSFTVEEASSVEAEFKTAAFKSEAEVETVHGEVPETTTLDGAGCEDVDLGEFIPGVDDNYDEECVVVLTSTGAETKFIASDESLEDTGHLVHEGGEYALEDALEVTAVDSQAKGTGPGLTPLSPVTLLTFNDPIAKDTTTLTFNQHIGEEEGLLTGVYSKTILLTLEQTA